MDGEKIAVHNLILLMFLFLFKVIFYFPIIKPLFGGYFFPGVTSKSKYFEQMMVSGCFVDVAVPKSLDHLFQQMKIR